MSTVGASSDIRAAFEVNGFPKLGSLILQSPQGEGIERVSE
jgi:hypothetical protein